MKRQTKADKFRDLATAIGQIRRGEPVRRIGAKDGSIPTHPVVQVDPTKTEKEVLAECLAWLRKRGIFCNRHDVGAGNFGHGYATYGIKSAGDIMGLTKSGIHFEIETKKGSGGRLSRLQQRRMKNIRDNNGIYLVVSGIEELRYYNEQYRYFC